MSAGFVTGINLKSHLRSEKTMAMSVMTKTYVVMEERGRMKECKRRMEWSMERKRKIGG